MVFYEPWYCLDRWLVHRLMREEIDRTIPVLPVCFLRRIHARPMHLELLRQIVHEIQGRLVRCYKCRKVITGHRKLQVCEIGLGHAIVYEF